MKVLIAIDSFKGSVSSIEGSQAIAEGVKEVYPNSEIIRLPLADGGEGTVDALVQATDGTKIDVEVTGPLQDKVIATYGITGDRKTAVIEVASACGLTLVPVEKRNPLETTSYGVGELILDAIHRGCREFIIGLGGSATNDAGIGMLQALGIQFLDKNGKQVGLGGQILQTIEKIEIESLNTSIQNCTFRIACDVTNPLCGPNGAAYVYGPQKGATSKTIEELDNGLKHFAEVVKTSMNQDINSIPGAGAAGGLGAAFFGFLDGTLQSGVEIVLDAIQMEKHMEGADFVITGEGRLDGQTSMGKAPIGVSKLARNKNIPVIALAGSTTYDTSILHEYGITSCFSITNEPMSLEKAMQPEIAQANLQTTTSQIFRLIKATRNKEEE
ncbi:glycerate kinase [Fredinandcohnia sp. 179-A 10B2 NHS]|uniref:glycerate kinase n=1 Tax=Fredinandcohnia sp. 179-A 10B2 NHS TaxID=3235176 RepID=UPI0039A1AB1B